MVLLDASSIRRQAKTIGVALQKLVASVETMLHPPCSVETASTPKRARCHSSASLQGEPPVTSEEQKLRKSLAASPCLASPKKNELAHQRAWSGDLYFQISFVSLLYFTELAYGCVFMFSSLKHVE
jgi:hypothetical protein